MNEQQPRLPLPGAPPDTVKQAIQTIFDEYQFIQKERQQWELERSQMRMRIIQLEAEARMHQQVRLDLVRRIKLLEHGLLQERNNYAADIPTKISSQAKVRALKRSESLHKLKPPGQRVISRTLPKNFDSPSQDVEERNPGRMFLREYLIELGYLKEAAHLDGHYYLESKSSKSDAMEQPVKMRAKASEQKQLTRPSPIRADRSGKEDSDWKAGHSPPIDREISVSSKGSFAKPAKPAPRHQRRNSINELLVEAKMAEAKRWKPTLPLKSHLDGVRCLQFHSTEPCIFTGSEDGTLKLWNVGNAVDMLRSKKKNLEPNYTFRGHTGMVTSVALAESRNLVFSSGTDGHINVWDMPSVSNDPYDADGQCTKFHRFSLRGHTDAVWDLACHPSSESMPFMFSASSDGRVGVWRIDTINTEMANSITYSGNDSNMRIPTSVCVANSDMKKLVIGYTSGEVVVCDIETGKVISAMASTVESAAANPHITSMKFHPSLSLAFTAHADHNCRIFDINQGACVNVIQTHRDIVTGLSIDPSGLYFASCSHDESLRFWDISSKKIIQDLDGYQTHRKKYDEAIHDVCHHPTKPLVATAGADSLVKLFE